MRVGIVGMGVTGLGAAQRLADLLEQSPDIQSKTEIHLFDIANEAGGQVKSYHDPKTKKTSELGAVIIFPSWKNIHSLLKRYNVETKPAPFAMQRFALSGVEAPPLIKIQNSICFLIQLNNYRNLFARQDYRTMLEQGTHAAPEELFTSVQDWATKHNIKFVVEMFQEFYSGCGYGQNIWEQPAVYVAQLMSYDVVMDLVKNALHMSQAKSVLDGYQKLWLNMARNLSDKKNFHFHYDTEITSVTQKYNTLNQCQYEIIAPTISMEFDKIIFANSPASILKIFKSKYEDSNFDLLAKTLRQSCSLNYQVVIATVSYSNARIFKQPSTRFFYESYRSRSDQKSAPVLDIMMYGKNINCHNTTPQNHMLYFYGNKGQADVTEEQVKKSLHDYNGEVHEFKHVENWNDYHQHFPIPVLKARAAQILHEYNLTNSAQIVGSITAMGHTEATVTQGILAAERVFAQLRSTPV